jgi:ribonuclease-3
MNNFMQEQKEKIKEFEKKIGIKFKDENLLIQSLVHRSYINENPKFELEHNERLEFLGDAVLELVVTEHLYKNYKESEGELTNWRAALVKTETLARVARELEIEKYLLMSKGEALQKDGKSRNTILANAFESLLGAIYLDKNYNKACDFIKKNLLKYLPEILEKKLYKDSKSLFQEIAQEKFKITPEYEVVKEEGPDHNKKFLIRVLIGEKQIAEGEGYSKQEAEEAAARKALDEID